MGDERVATTFRFARTLRPPYRPVAVARHLLRPEENKWKWQRPNLFCTNEDLFTQTIVVPYLIPMLERAGAVVYTPRERDWQRNEVIVDNDAEKGYVEDNGREKWRTTEERGFAFHRGMYRDGENPFEQGTARMVRTTRKNNESWASYQPTIPQSGHYAVYVSYQTIAKSVSDAQYIVVHKGERTLFRVNQQMGGSTWVYLGTFDFDAGNSAANRVIVTNSSAEKGVVTTDAVRLAAVWVTYSEEEQQVVCLVVWKVRVIVPSGRVLLIQYMQVRVAPTTILMISIRALIL